MVNLLTAFVENLPRLPKRTENSSPNPIELASRLSLVQWGMFFSGWLAWTMDAFDFFCVSLAVKRLAVAFAKENHTVTFSITLTLLFRSLGAAMLGLLSDGYGRKWPLVINLIVLAILQLGTSFVKTWPQFLAVRSLFGIAMGGTWGLSIANALENMPVECRGLFSGILQQGYAVGYLIAAVVNLTAVADHNDYRLLFWIGSGLSLFSAIFRAVLPESQYFLDRKAQAAGEMHSGAHKVTTFLKEAGKALKTHWIRCIYAILLMTGFNFFSHGSQDLYPTFISEGKGLGEHAGTVATIIGNCGAIAGGTFAGYISQYLGRRITIIVFCIWAAVWIPLWLLPAKFGGLAAGAFMVQFGVQGAWGVVPIYLTEISPVAFRATWPGVAYQLGNMASSASSQIEATAGEQITTADGTPDYGKVSAILIGTVAGYLIILTLLGREQHAAQFEHGKAAFEHDGGKDVYADADEASTRRESDLGVKDGEKGTVTAHEHDLPDAAKKEQV